MMQVNVDGVKIAYDESGSGATLVLLHGYPLSRAMWDAHVETLAAHARVVRIDFRGMGESAFTPGPYLMESLAADVAGVLDAIGVDRAGFVGHSMGGYVAMAFARMFTERVERLALLCSRLDADDADRIAERNRWADQLEHGDVQSLRIDPMLADPSAADQQSLRERIQALVQANDPRALAQMQRGLALRDASFDIAEELDIPVLLIAGRRDHLVPAHHASAMAAAFPRASLQWCEQSGHLAPLEEPERVNELLTAFLDLR